jgi:hypothetical protein
LSTDLKYSKELVELRRNEVLRLVAQAIPQNEIAQKLGVSSATISLDLQYLREKAKANIRNHIDEAIPMQYAECQAGLKLILRKTYDIVDKSTRTQEILSAMSLAVDIYGKLMDLSTNGAILEKTTKWINELKEKKSEVNMSSNDIEAKEDFLEDDDEEPTTTLTPTEAEEDLGEE